MAGARNDAQGRAADGQLHRLRIGEGRDLVVLADDHERGARDPREARRRVRPSQQRAAEIYDEAELRRFRVLAAERNAAGDGDTAAFYLRR